MSEGKTLIVDLLRHGEVKAAPGFFGSTDVALSAKGEAQMAHSIRLNALLRSLSVDSSVESFTAPWQLIVSSPLQRCRVFAEYLSAKFKIPLAIEAGFKEIHFGDWEGLTAERIMEKDPEGFQAYCDAPLDNPPSSGETYAAFDQRIAETWRNYTRSAFENPQQQRILVICHGGVIRTTLRQVLQSPAEMIFSWDCPYGCYSQIRYFRDKTQQHVSLVSHNSRLKLSE